MFKELVRICKHTVIYGFGSLIRRMIGFLMVPVYTRFLTPLDYGVSALITLTTVIAETLLLDSIQNILSRFYFDYKKEKDKQELVGTVFLVQLFVSVITSIIVILVSPQISQLLFGSEEYTLFIKLAFIAFALGSMNGVYLTLIRIKEKSMIYTTISVARLILALSLNILFIVYMKLGLIGIFLSLLVASGVEFIILTPLLLRETKLVFSKLKIAPMLNYALPLIPSGIFMLALLRTDTIMLEKLSTTAQVGLYSLADTFGQIPHLMIIVPFGLIWAPFVFSEIRNKESTKIFSKIQTYATFLVLFAGLGMAILIKPVSAFLLGIKFTEIYKVVPILVLAFILLGLYQRFFEIGAMIQKKTKFILLMTTSAILINIISNLILIPKLGYLGAAISKLITFSALCLIGYMLSFKTYHIPIEKRVVGIFFVAFAYYIISTFISSSSVIYQLVWDSVLLATFPITLYLFSFFKKEEIDKAKEIIGKVKKIRFKDIIKHAKNSHNLKA